MASVLNRTTKQYIESANTPDYPTAQWIQNPDLSSVTGFASKYWTITGDTVTLMSQAERDAVDAAEVASANAAKSLADMGQNSESVLLRLTDDFAAGGTSSGTIGELGWAITNVTSAPTITRGTPVFPHFGAIVTTTVSTAGRGASISLPATLLPDLTTAAPWVMLWTFKLTQTTAMRFRIGLLSQLGVVEPAGGIYLRYDTATGFADTQFKFNTRSASVSTVQNGPAVGTTWHSLKIASFINGQIQFSMDGGALTTITSNIPTVSLTPGFVITTDAAAAKAVEVDYFAFKLGYFSR